MVKLTHRNELDFIYDRLMVIECAIYQLHLSLAQTQGDKVAVGNLEERIEAMRPDVEAADGRIAALRKRLHGQNVELGNK